MPAKAPNILIVMADQMAPAFLPIYGHPLTRAPNMQALAQQGVVFESAYCNSPLCSPSRASFMSGSLPSRTRAYDNAAEFGADVPTFAHYLRDRGYQTILSGKMHFCGPDQLHGFEQRLTTDIYPADFGWTPDWDHPEHPPELVSQHELGPAGRPLRPHQPARLRRRNRLHGRAGDLRHCAFKGSEAVSADGFVHPSPRSVCRAATLLGPLSRPDIDMPGPPIAPEALDPHSRRLRHVCAMDAEPVTEAQVRNARHAYYGAIAYIDDNLGRLMPALRSAGLAENTIVILTSDHGEMLGERGLWYKMSFFEGASRVPLVIASPGRFAPRRVAASVSLVDIMPTLVDISGGSAQALGIAIDGRSLGPHLAAAGAAMTKRSANISPKARSRRS